MSASIDQRSKGQPSQVPNGQTSSKETVKEGEFEAYFENQHQQGSYPAAPPPMANASDPYMPGSYYNPMTFPYLNQGLDSNAWSNGGDSMAFLSGGNYGQMGSDYMSAGNGMFPGFDYNPNPGFAWGFPEYSAWGNATSQGRKSDTRGYDEYYAHPENMGTSDNYNMNMNGDLEGDNSVKNVEQGLQGMSLSSDVQPALEDSSPVSTGIENPMTATTNEGTSPGSTSANSAASTSAAVSAAPKKMTWASIASQPAKPQPALKHSIPRAPVAPGKQNMEIGNWDTNNKSGKPAQSGQQRTWTAAPWNGRSTGQQGYVPGPGSGTSGQSSSNSGNAGLTTISAPQTAVPSHPVLDRLRSANQYNPKSFEVNPKNVRFFIIKSYSEDDIHRSIKYSIWCSTETGNKRLDKAFQDQDQNRGPIYLLYSVNGSGHFCGMAQMMSRVDYDTSTGVWAQDKWKGKFEVKWIYVKDVPNSQLRGIRLENNENKPVTNSRDTQEVMPDKGRQVLRIIHQYRHTTSIFDDFGHYEKRQEEDKKGPQRRN